MTPKPSLAILGAPPRFDEALPVGQFHWPRWEGYEAASRDIFARRFYTSQRFAGPLVARFERRLEEFLGVRRVVVVRNATNALMIATHTMGLRGRVIAPAWTFVASVQALVWSNCKPVFCDIDPDTQQMSIPSVIQLLDRGGIAGILGVHCWGGAAPVDALARLSEEYRVPVYYDAAQAFGCHVSDRAVGSFGQTEAFSFHAANILNTAEGGCLATNDDALAAQFEAMRGDHVPGGGAMMQSATSRLSEIQAAIGLMLLDEFEAIQRNNEEQHRRYENHLATIPGINLLKPAGVTLSNFQHAVCIVDALAFGLIRDQLLTVLKAENVAAERQFFPLPHSIPPLSEGGIEYGRLANTELASQRTLQLPIGALLTTARIDLICETIAEAHRQAEVIQAVCWAPFAGQSRSRQR
jgi:dTDP-4-amino-4,6-dideoxygalactose transaminase